MKINFISESIDFQLNKEEKYSKWLEGVIKEEGKKLGEITYHFTGKEEILAINIKYLDHHYYTDIITFDNSFRDQISCEIYISIPVVRENAKRFEEISFKKELARVIVHGVLHCMGYTDDNERSIEGMRKKENYYINYLDEL